MSLASIGYREVEKIVSTWTQKYQYHVSLVDTKPEQAKFMVQFSLTKPQRPIPIGTVRVYFTCKNVNDQLDITFRFQKDSLIHSVDNTIRHKQLQKWIDDALSKKLLVRQTVFYLGTSYQQTRVKDQRQDKILEEKVVIQEPQFICISPDLLQDQFRSIQVMEQPAKNDKNISNKINAFWKEIDRDYIKVITYPELRQLLKNMGINLSQEEFNVVLNRVDKDDTGTIEFERFYEIGYEIIESFEAKKIAENRLSQKKQQQTFGSILTLINDQSQSIQDQMIQKFKAKDQDQTGVTNIQQIKNILEEFNSAAKQLNKQQPLSAIEMAEITKILTDLYGYKEIPYVKVHKHIIDMKITNFSKGRVGSYMNNLEVYLRDIFDQYDEKKFGKILATNLLEAIKKCQKITLTKAQLYVLENILPKDSKGQVNYIELSKFLSEIIKKFYIFSNKKKQIPFQLKHQEIKPEQKKTEEIKPEPKKSKKKALKEKKNEEGKTQHVQQTKQQKVKNSIDQKKQ